MLKVIRKTKTGNSHTQCTDRNVYTDARKDRAFLMQKGCHRDKKGIDGRRYLQNTHMSERLEESACKKGMATHKEKGFPFLALLALLVGAG